MHASLHFVMSDTDHLMNNCLLIKRREVETKCQLEQLRNEMAANRSLKEESESTVEQLKETIHQKDASVREIEDELKVQYVRSGKRLGTLQLYLLKRPMRDSST